MKCYVVWSYQQRVLLRIGFSWKDISGTSAMVSHRKCKNIELLNIRFVRDDGN